jgi:hypothetical protein
MNPRFELDQADLEGMIFQALQCCTCSPWRRLRVAAAFLADADLLAAERTALSCSPQPWAASRMIFRAGRPETGGMVKPQL